MPVITVTPIGMGVHEIEFPFNGQHTAIVDDSVLLPMLNRFQKQQLVRAGASNLYNISKPDTKILFYQLPDHNQPLTRQQAVDIVKGITGEAERTAYTGYYYRARKNEYSQWVIHLCYCDGGYGDDDELSKFVLEKGMVYKKQAGKPRLLVGTYEHELTAHSIDKTI